MLAEIFMLRLEALRRDTAAPTTTASDVRFVPLKQLPPEGKPERTAQ